MKATGIVRRIDDLGRVVIPKEIRRTQMIRVGDPLEIFVSSTGEVIFKKYSPVGELAGEAEHLVEALYKNAGVSALVTDRDKVVAAAGSLRPAAGQALAPEYSSRMKARRLYAQDGTLFDVCAGVGAGLMTPILSSGDLIGSVAIRQGEAANQECAAMLARVAAFFLGRRLEE